MRDERGGAGTSVGDCTAAPIRSQSPRPSTGWLADWKARIGKHDKHPRTRPFALTPTRVLSRLQETS